MMVTFAGLRAVADYLRHRGRLPRGLRYALYSCPNEVFSNSPICEHDDLLLWLTRLEYVYPVRDGAPALVAWIREQWQARARELFGGKGPSVFDLCQQLRAWRGSWTPHGTGRRLQDHVAAFDDPTIEIGVTGAPVNLLDRGKALPPIDTSRVKEHILNFVITQPLDLRLPSLLARVVLLANLTTFDFEIRAGRLYVKCPLEAGEALATCGARKHGRVLRFDNFAIGDLGRWARHVDKSPTAALAFTDDGAVYLKSLRRLAPGEEITVTYTTKPIQCFSCRRLASMLDGQTRLFFCSENCFV